MRQLANVSAKNALHKHESKRLSANTRTKLLVTSVAVVVGVSLLVIHQLPGAPPVTIYGAVAAFAVAALWGVNYLALVSRMARERMAYMSRHLKVGEEPVAGGKEGNPDGRAGALMASVRSHDRKRSFPEALRAVGRRRKCEWPC